MLDTQEILHLSSWSVSSRGHEAGKGLPAPVSPSAFLHLQGSKGRRVKLWLQLPLAGEEDSQGPKC